MKQAASLETLLKKAGNDYVKVKLTKSLTLIEVLPELTTSLIAALQSEGSIGPAKELESAQIDSWTYDKSVNNGYIYIRQKRPVHHGECSVAITVAFAFPEWFNVDLRSSGEIFGIELLSEESIFAHLATISF